MSAAGPLVGIVMGSQSDWETMQHAAAMLDRLGISYEARIVSAHRTPERLYEYARTARARGLCVIIAGAGGAAHLPGMTAALTPLPVLGFPIRPSPPPWTAGGRRRRRPSANARTDPDSGGMLAPGATIGILGGGQLGRMIALAAARLGYRCHIFADEEDSPAAQVCNRATVADFYDMAALDAFAAAIDVATIEFENIPAEAVRRIAARKPTLPRPEILEIAQDRLREKDFLRAIGVATTAYRAVHDAAELESIARDFGAPAVLKTVRMGYDGKGQVMLRPDTPAAQAWRRMGGEIGILEKFVDFACEISVIIARSANGEWAAYPPVENRHTNHILDTTIAPARIAAAL